MGFDKSSGRYAVVGAIALVCLFAARWVQAAIIWQEQSPGAGESIAASQVTTGPLGSLSAIKGTLNSSTPPSGSPEYEVDIFAIFISDYTTFSARTVSANSSDDTALFLFDSTGLGLGVYMNDDTSIDLLSFLPPPPPGPSANHVFYIAIGLGGFVPVDSTSTPIFQAGAYTDVLAVDPLAGPLAGWQKISSQSEAPFDYQVDLTGTRVANVVPEPTTAALLLLAVAGLGASRVRQRGDRV